MNDSAIEQVLDYWFDDCYEAPSKCEARSKIWYGGGPEADEEIEREFGELYKRACSDSLSSWAETADGALALVIVLDQFSRQIHRRTSLAFAQDSMARAIARRCVSTKLDRELSVPARLFLYHPFQHSEHIEDQVLGVRLTQRVLEECQSCWQEYVAESLKFFEDHRDIIERFGRFPHRNRVLGRESTPEELEFLGSSSNYGQ